MSTSISPTTTTKHTTTTAATTITATIAVTVTTAVGQGGPSHAKRNEDTVASPAIQMVVANAKKIWQERIKEWYPDYKKRSYEIHPVFLNRVKYKTVHRGRTEVYVPLPLEPGRASELVGDGALRKVLRSLRGIPGFRSEVMFVISQLLFENYLSSTAFAAAASALPRPADRQAENEHRGDFDLLVIHRRHGFLVGEVKAVGELFPPDMPVAKQDETIAQKIKVAVKQLRKAGRVLRHVSSDQKAAPRIQKTLMLPNVSQERLQTVLAHDPQLRESLCQCLDVPADPVPLCLTSDSLTCPGIWWRQRMTEAGLDPAMDDDLYLDIVSRFAGPASTVEVACTSAPRLNVDHVVLRTEGQQAAAVAWRFTRLMLHPDQLDVLDSQHRLVLLTGPPGCGKSTVLLLKALQWLHGDRHVHIVSTGVKSLAVSHGLRAQLLQTATGKGGSASALADRLHLHSFFLSRQAPDFVQEAVRSLEAWARGGQLFVIADEASIEGFEDLLWHLHGRLRSGLHLWAAHYLRDKYVFPNLARQLSDLVTVFRLTQALRTPPAVTSEVRQSVDVGDREGGAVLGYSEPVGPAPTQGPEPRVLQHVAGLDGHGEGDAVDCVRCGAEVALILKDLRVGVQDSTEPNSLRYKDVFVLGDIFSSPFKSTPASLSSSVALARDQAGHAQQVREAGTGSDSDATISSSSNVVYCGLLRGLTDAGFPVTVVTQADTEAIAQLGAMAGPDVVTAADRTVVSGLERAVVVYVAGEADVFGRLHCVSRCTSFLVWVQNRSVAQGGAATLQDLDRKESGRS